MRIPRMTVLSTVGMVTCRKDTAGEGQAGRLWRGYGGPEHSFQLLH